MPILNKQEIEDAVKNVHKVMPPTPQFKWPLLAKYVGAEVWVKHENHTPTGAFKIRGGITFIEWLKREHPKTKGIVTATRGNHGQSQALAATAAGLRVKIIVPFGNSIEKNQAMRAFGGQVIEYGNDFDMARIEAQRISKEEHYYMVPPFHTEIIRGVSSYPYELLTSIKDLDTVYAPIGCGSGICSIITVRDALGLSTKVVGVVSTEANAAKLSVETGQIMETDSATTFADGIAVRVIVPEAFEIYSKGVDRVVAVNDDEIAEAIRIYFRTIHNAAEGAGAAPLAALIKEKARMQGKKVAVILSGGNIDSAQFQLILNGGTPTH